MKNSKRKNPLKAKPLANGQVWHMAESDLHIKDVGRLLVQYKLFRGAAKEPPTVMSAMRAVEGYLTQNKAVLVRE
jgi:hypothetical protein